MIISLCLCAAPSMKLLKDVIFSQYYAASVRDQSLSIQGGGRRHLERSFCRTRRMHPVCILGVLHREGNFFEGNFEAFTVWALKRWCVHRWKQ